MTRKTAGDLDPKPSSVGGAMSQWPRRTINWICRDLRVNSVDPFVAEMLLEREVNDLYDLQTLAVDIGIEATSLNNKIRALEDNDTEKIMDVIDRSYEARYGSNIPGVNRCPFEESGMDKACWRCPIAGNVLDELAEG